MKPAIIEIGIVEVDLEALATTREKAHFVRPRRWDISARCTEFTGISAVDIRAASPFPEVLASIVEEFAPSKALCCFWGDDAAIIEDACRACGLRSPLRNLLDLAGLFHRLFLLRDQASLQKAVEILGLEFEGVPHGALADARNTARIHADIIRRMGREPAPPTASSSHVAHQETRSEFAEKLFKSLRREQAK
jgi:inhibitor of KinA sporulation pathway (predicted exonuclease)